MIFTKYTRSGKTVGLALITMALLAGCDTAPRGWPVNIKPDHGLPVADVKKPLLILVAERGNSHADTAALGLFESSFVGKNQNIATTWIDVGESRNRAVAARYHIPETPVLVCLSPRGVIISRDEKSITKKILRQRIDDAIQQSPELDAKLMSLEEAIRQKPDDLAAQFALTDFLLAHHNDFEAIPHLEAIAYSDENPPDARIRAWVALARAHLWIAEPEKGRHEAQDLIAILGPVFPDARAGGNLVLGLQVANGKRAALARQEFENAIAVAPQSVYGREASEVLSKLTTTTH